MTEHSTEAEWDLITRTENAHVSLSVIVGYSQVFLKILDTSRLHHFYTDVRKSAKRRD